MPDGKFDKLRQAPPIVDGNRPVPSGAKLLCMWAALIAIPFVGLLLLVLGYYAFAKLTYSAYTCGSFARLDDEIGWTLAPSVESCLGGRGVFTRTPWFESPVYTDANGFRAARPGAPTSVGGLMAVGDSYTFGYGVTFEQSYAGELERLSHLPVVTAASPAYSSAQALLLAQRWVPRIKPKAIVYLDNGMWTRDACRGPYRPTAILKPCYWQPPGAAAAELVIPPPGRIAAWAKWGVLPGGMIGPGETGWDYFLVSRPVLQVEHLLTLAGIVSGFGHDFAAVGVDDTAIRRAVLAHLGRLAEAARVPVIFLDSENFYPPDMLDELPASQRAFIDRIGKERWDREVEAPAALLPPDQRTVPHDDHFGAGRHRLIAEMLARELNRLGITQ